MAVTAAQITNFKIVNSANGLVDFIFTYTPGSSYTASGEVLTRAVARAGLQGISEIYSLACNLAYKTADGSDGSVAAFEILNTATVAGTFHIYAATDAHLHSFLVVGGTAAAGTDELNIKGTTPVTIGKEAATNATNVGGVGGGVQNSSIDVLASEVAAASNFSAYSIQCRGVGRA